MLRSIKLCIIILTITTTVPFLLLRLSQLQNKQVTLSVSRHAIRSSGPVRNNTGDPEYNLTSSATSYSDLFRKMADCDEECRQVMELNERIDCRAIMADNREALSSAERYMKSHPKLSVPKRVRLPVGCRPYETNPFYRRVASSVEEELFPIAYSIVVHRNPAQLERLLRAVYWPQNIYCIHVDAKAGRDLADYVTNLVRCLPNVITADREYVIYAGYSRLKADLNCMSKLLGIPQRWNYVINLTGEEFPLKTNRELVKILRIYNGSNDIEGMSGHVTNRFRSRYVNRWRADRRRGVMRIDRGSHGLPIAHPPAPDNITLVKGSAFGVFSRRLVEFVFSDSTVKRLLAWLEHVWSPDEFFWATLNSGYHNPALRVPGSYAGRPDLKPWLAKFVSWPPRDRCKGRRVRGICVLSSGDLPVLVKRRELFANKFYLGSDYVALHCLEQWIYNRTIDVTLTFDERFYRKLPFVGSPDR